MVGLASGLMLSYSEGGDPSCPAVLMLPGPTDSSRSDQPILGLLPSLHPRHRCFPARAR